jgi:hypothetical protein
MSNIEKKNAIQEDTKFLNTVLEWIESFNKDSVYTLETKQECPIWYYSLQVALDGTVREIGAVDVRGHTVEIFRGKSLGAEDSRFHEVQTPEAFSAKVVQRIEALLVQPDEIVGPDEVIAGESIDSGVTVTNEATVDSEEPSGPDVSTDDSWIGGRLVDTILSGRVVCAGPAEANGPAGATEEDAASDEVTAGESVDSEEICA